MTEHCEKCSELADVYRAENTELKARLEEARAESQKYQNEADDWEVRAVNAERQLWELKGSTVREVVDRYGPEEHQRKLVEIFNAEQRAEAAERRVAELTAALSGLLSKNGHNPACTPHGPKCDWLPCAKARAALATASVPLSPQTPESEQEIEAEQYQATVDTLVGEGPQERFCVGHEDYQHYGEPVSQAEDAQT